MLASTIGLTIGGLLCERGQPLDVFAILFHRRIVVAFFFAHALVVLHPPRQRFAVASNSELAVSLQRERVARANDRYVRDVYGIAQVGTAQVGTAQVGTAQVGTAQDGTAQDGTAQDGTAQDGIAQDGTAQVGTAQDGTAQDGTAQDGTAQDGIAQDGTAQVGTAQDGTAQDGTAFNRRLQCQFPIIGFDGKQHAASYP
jgi:hypothetical protein